jgi:segregation and condensation protein B
MSERVDLTELTDAGEIAEPAEEIESAAVPERLAAAGPELPLRAQLEAVLLVAEEPVPVITLAERLEVPVPQIEATLRELAEEYLADERGFELRDVGGGWRYYTAAAAGDYVERFVLAGQTSRLSQAALETLAVVAYQQPVSRGRIAAVRGVNVDGVVRTLLTRRLIEEVGVDPEGGAMTYRTTSRAPAAGGR